MGKNKKWYKQSSMDENLIAVVKNLIHQIAVPVTHTSIVKSLSIHNQTQSLSSIIKTLNSWNIDTMAVSSSVESIADIILPAISQVSSNGLKYFILITEVGNGKITYIDPISGWVSQDISEFQKIWENIVLMIDYDKNSGEKDYNLKRKSELYKMGKKSVFLISALLFMMGIFIVGYENYFDIIQFWIPLLIIKTFGSIICVLLLITQFNSSLFAKRFCEVNKLTSCNSVLSSKASELIPGLSMSELGIYYFIGGVLSLVIGLFSTQFIRVIWFLSIVNIATLPYTIFSIYYQAKIIKQWCPFCLIVQILFWTEFLICYELIMSPESLTYSSTLLLLFSFTLPIIIWLCIKPIIKKYKEVKNFEQHFNKIRLDPGFFISFLNNQKAFENVRFSNEIIFGNSDAPLTLTLIINPYCKPCSVVHSKINDLLSEYPKQLKVIIRFLPAIDIHIKNTIEHFISIFLVNGIRNFELALNHWYKQKEFNYNEWAKKFPKPIGASKLEIQKLWDEHQSWVSKTNLKTTPSLLINDKLFSDQIFNVNDLTHFIDIIK